MRTRRKCSCAQAASAKDPLCRLFARMALSGLPRGGGDGDAIRMGILHIMRENGIREGHRPVSAVMISARARVRARTRVV